MWSISESVMVMLSCVLLGELWLEVTWDRDLVFTLHFICNKWLWPGLGTSELNTGSFWPWSVIGEPDGMPLPKAVSNWLGEAIDGIVSTVLKVDRGNPILIAASWRLERTDGMPKLLVVHSRSASLRHQSSPAGVGGVLSGKCFIFKLVFFFLTFPSSLSFLSFFFSCIVVFPG